MSSFVSDHPAPSSTNITIQRCQTLDWSGPEETTTMLTQFALFLVCCGSLIIKYFVFEKPRRPCCTWFWDSQKQGWGAALAHGLNLIFSAILVKYTTGGDPCAWYFINISVDTFIGVFLIFFMIEKVEGFAKARNIESLSRSGDYGTPPRWDWWLQQFLMYCSLVAVTKLITFLGVFLLRNQLNSFGLWVWSPLLGDPFTELILVMIITPAVMNAWVFWVTDTFIMMMSDKNAERYPTWCCCCCNKCKDCLGKRFKVFSKHGNSSNNDNNERETSLLSDSLGYGAVGINGINSRESSFSGSSTPEFVMPEPIEPPPREL